MSTTILALDESVYQRLHVLSDRVGQSPDAVLDQALADYEQKLLSGEHPLLGSAPRASAEAEFLDDPGRIRLSPRGQQAVLAQVVSVGRPPCRALAEQD